MLSRAAGNRLALCLALLTVTATAATAVARDGHLLILVAEDFAHAVPLGQFLAHKRAQGLTVETAKIDPGLSNTTIRNLVRNKYESLNPPDYVLIIGDTSGQTSTAATIPHFVGGGSKSATTDLPYGCMDDGDDWQPELPVGRFSVTSTAELQAIVDKTIAVESGVYDDPDYVKRVAFLATSDTSAQSEETHEWVITNYLEPADYTPIRIYANSGGDTSDITNAVNDGVVMMVYFGHSSSSGWWTPSFDQGDIQALNNSMYGLVFGFSCNTAHFDYDECFGETWIRASHKGAAAYISASTYIYYGGSNWESSRRLEKFFFESFFVDDIWEVGPAWRAGLYRFLDDWGSGDVTRNMFEMFTLLGDPSLELPRPFGFSMDVDPGQQVVCAPPTDMVQYDITIEPLADFNEPVTLSVSDLPPGASADFSVNNAVPPFTSTLTVSGLAGAAPGTYDPVVQGTSASAQRAAAVGLTIFAGLPAQVSLTSPADGAVDVPLMPTLTWEGVSDAADYSLEIATDAAFANVVYSTTTTATSHTVPTPLGMIATHYWRVHASNACGDGPYSVGRSFTTINMILPSSYDMLNGETGTYTYFDDSYNGNGDPTEPLSPLSGGLGELVDGVIATQHWNQANGPYVGWVSVDPTITFHFDLPVNISAITLHIDDDGGGGGVDVPDDVTVVMGGTTLEFDVTDPPGGSPFGFTMSDLNLSGDTLEITLADHSTGGYMMLSEVEFVGGPDYGACCIGAVCSMQAEADCLAAGGAYEGDGTDCDPNPCQAGNASCLIISEVVDGTLSGGCPKWIEITNTGTADYTFSAGGVIVQKDNSTDVVVDVDLTGTTVPAGQAIVVVSTEGGQCSNAFNFIYGITPDVQTTVPFGDGNERYILTDTADGSNLLDIYGVFGDGAAAGWSYEDGYAFRLPWYNSGNDGTFDAAEWFIGGKDSLEGENAEELLLTLTDPTVHDFAEDCPSPAPGDIDNDGDIDWVDFELFLNSLAGPDVTDPPPGCLPEAFGESDFDHDGDVDMNDAQRFQQLFAE